MPDIIAVKLEKIINIIIKGTIFLLPLFFLPWTGEYFEFNKQFLLWWLMPAALWLWLVKTAFTGKLKIKTDPLNLPVLIFLILNAAAALLSLDRFSSFFGSFGKFSDAWLGLLSLIIFYFLIINTGIADSSKKIIDLLKLFFYSSIVVAVVSLSAMLGVLKLFTGDGLSMVSSISFNLAGGSALGLAIFLAVLAVVLSSFLIASGLKKIDRIFYSSGLIVSLIVLIFIDFSSSWLLLFLGAILIIFFYWLKFGLKFIKNHYLLIPVALILLSLFFLTWPHLNLIKKITGQDLPKETLLSYDQALIITKETIKKNPALGSGPGTFSEDFSLFRPAELNYGALWQIRFQKSSSHLLEMLATGGLLTFLSYILIISLIIYLNIILINEYFKRQALTDEDYYLITALLIVFILIFISQLFFLTNTVLNFIFWLYLSLLIAFWHNRRQVLFKEKIINLHESALFYRLFLTVLFILSAGWIVILIFEARFFAADIIAAREYNRETNLLTAIKLNPRRYNYRLSLAKLYLNKAKTEVLKPIEQRNSSRVQFNITRAIETAKQAELRAPNSVLPHETLGMIYRDSRPLTIGSEAWAIKSFKRAFSLEPTNPVLATELAKAYLNNNDLDNAEEYFRQAMELKADYYEAKFGLAKTYLNLKKDRPALILLNELASEIQSPEVYYELGRLYYNKGEIDKAIDRFQLVLSISPKHSNGLYSLAIAYEAQGNFQESLKYLEKVLELNPGNSEVEKKIKTLSK